jgi:hypothetical protein
MNFDAAEALTRAVLYEGYVLYPYRPTSLKNRQRWSFGGLVPPPAGERAAGPSVMQMQCLAAGADAAVSVRVRFLHLVSGQNLAGEGTEEAVEREVCIPETKLKGLEDSTQRLDFSFEPIRREGGAQEVVGVVEVRAESLGGVRRVTVRVENTSRPGRLGVLASTHIVIGVSAGTLISATDPPKTLLAEAASCKNEGCWPVLLGREGSGELMLASPIILYDYPKVAPDSPGDLFDATEIDEILALRILTLTEEEKRLARASDPRVGALVDRVEALSPEQWRRLHGSIGPRTFEPGDRVRLSPKSRADVLDIALAGRCATVASVETDFEDNVYVTVTVDDDPGRDLGLRGQPGHRFFFRLDEVEAL